MMKWNKQGQISLEKYIKAESLACEFTMLPTPVCINGKMRIFIGFCDSHNVGRIGYIDVNPNNPKEVLNVSSVPCLDIGRNGCFDDNGVVPLSVIVREGEIHLYYVGFQLGVKIPYFMFGGLAVSRDGGETFERLSETPILDRRGDEVFARCGMYVMEDDNIFKMWYIGSVGEGWTESGGKLRPLYTMRYLESKDGVHWMGEPVTCMEYKNEDEHGFGRPYVWKEQNMYKMLYSIRTYSRGYYIGYAESLDGINWERKDDLAGISLSADGWDSKNISYPCIVKYQDKKYLFYNGNGCGKEGFGYAEFILS